MEQQLSPCHSSAYNQAKNTAPSEGLVVPIGIDSEGNLFYQDISKISHFLVSGFTGSGKTHFVQSLITYLSNHYPVDDTGFIIYDFKSVDYASFNALPNLVFPIISDPQKVASIISLISYECKKRLSLLANFHSEEIISHNKKCSTVATGKLPHWFLILDDFSSIHFNNEATSSLMEIFLYGRSVGIHLVFVTSLTSSKILQKDILSNIPCRVSFCVSTKSDSRIAIGQNGAENLGPGELIFRYYHNIVKCQRIYAPEQCTPTIIQNSQYKSTVSRSPLVNMNSKISDNSIKNTCEHSSHSLSESDELFFSAVEIALNSSVISTSILQKELKLDYKTAANLMDIMEQRSIISSFDGLPFRKVLITRDQWDSSHELSKTL